MSPSLVQVKLEPPDIKEEQGEELLQRPEEAAGSALTLPAVKNDDENGETEPQASTSTEHVLVQVKLEPPDIKEEQGEELLQRPEEAAGSALTLPAVKNEDDDENGDTEPQASTSTEHMKTQAYMEYWVRSQPTSDDQLLSSHRFESDIIEDSDDWPSHCSESGDERETSEQQSALNTLKSHKRRVKGQILSLRNKLSQDLKSSKQTPSTRSQTGKNILFCCTECGKVCGSKGDLEIHMRTHTGERPFPCTVCSKGFNQAGVLKTHMRIHTGEKPFTCTVCNKSFNNSANMKTHMSIHTGKKPFACTVCNKSFTNSANMKTHMSIHTGEKPFACTVCNKSFRRAGHLKTHMVIHTGEKHFACTVCSQSFNRAENLKAHTRIHTGEKPFACTACTQSFNQAGNLKEHMRIHTGEKSFDCTVCSQGFRYAGNLKTHMRIHTGERPFACTVCSQSFNQAGNLKTHMRIHDHSVLTLDPTAEDDFDD